MLLIIKQPFKMVINNVEIYVKLNRKMYDSMNTMFIDTLIK
ncbi:hypothetical protein AC96_5100 [Escherichia coli 2-156-04_S4_C2]|nr:hypothetical protein AC96_5100 [Escherichia coli 2-156-04_S4_C2]